MSATAKPGNTSMARRVVEPGRNCVTCWRLRSVGADAAAVSLKAAARARAQSLGRARIPAAGDLLARGDRWRLPPAVALPANATRAPSVPPQLHPIANQWRLRPATGPAAAWYEAGPGPCSPRQAAARTDPQPFSSKSRDDPGPRPGGKISLAIRPTTPTRTSRAYRSKTRFQRFAYAPIAFRP